MNIQFQKVIDGLQHHAGLTEWECWQDNGEEFDEENPPKEYCPYYDENDCGAILLKNAIELLKRYDDALRLMVYQYCTLEKGQFENGWPEKEIFFNRHMSAGENAFKVLGIENEQEVPEDWI